MIDLIPPSPDVAIKPYRVLIIGSCVTRDVFRAFGEGVIISDYFARTSIPSLISKPLAFDPSQIKLPSEFQKRMITRDLDKSLWTRLERGDYDLVLLDMIDERFPLMKSEDKIFTKSNELVTSGFLDHNPGRFVEISKTEYGMSQWGSDCVQFARRLESIIPRERIVVIKAFWASRYLDMGGDLKRFDDKTKFHQEYVNRSNDQLISLYKVLVKNVSGGQVINMPDPLADANHVWGLSPFHYTDEWYHFCRDQLDKIASEVLM